MRKIILLFLNLFIINSLFASKTQTFHINFNEADFTFSYNSNGLLEIYTSNISVYSESNEPMLPVFSSDFAIQGNCEFISFSFSFKKRLIRSNVKITQSPLPVPNNELSNQVNLYKDPTYPLLIYPKSNCQYVGISKWDKISVFHFISSPFIYDAVEKNLYIIDNIELNIEYDYSEYSTDGIRFGRPEKSILSRLVKNPEIVNATTISPFKTKSNDRIDYVIITNASLSQTFLPLLNWKKTKGLYSKIITVEEIASTYEGNDIPLKIKKYLYDLYCNYGLQYVLLGGDDTVVPVRGCHAKVNGASGVREDNCIPADIYYSCFSGDFTWDYNNNGIYGEAEDEIVLSSYINITRLPVRSITDTEIIVDKIIKYEKEPTVNKKMLLAGKEIHYSDTTNNRSDASIYANLLDKTYIKPFWDGDTYHLFDTNSDFSDENNYKFNVENLINQIKNGYAFLY